ncbi:hypothetical protein QBW32_49155 (plasmid) [Streptomyces acidiscabies]
MKSKSKSAAAATTAVGTPPAEESPVTIEPVVVAEDVENDDPFVPA